MHLPADHSLQDLPVETATKEAARWLETDQCRMTQGAFNDYCMYNNKHIEGGLQPMLHVGGPLP